MRENGDGTARGQAFWRGSSDWNIHLNLVRGLWCDYARGSHRESGGTVLGLISVVTGLSSAESGRWLYGDGWKGGKENGKGGKEGWGDQGQGGKKDQGKKNGKGSKEKGGKERKEVFEYYAESGEKVLEIHRWEGEGRKADSAVFTATQRVASS